MHADALPRPRRIRIISRARHLMTQIRSDDISSGPETRANLARFQRELASGTGGNRPRGIPTSSGSPSPACRERRPFVRDNYAPSVRGRGGEARMTRDPSLTDRERANPPRSKEQRRWAFFPPSLPPPAAAASSLRNNSEQFRETRGIPGVPERSCKFRGRLIPVPGWETCPRLVLHSERGKRSWSMDHVNSGPH
jgi:hypothetical protein